MSQLEIAPKTIIEACFTPDGTADLAVVYDVAAAVGVADQPVRVAIRRLEAAGTLHQVGRGRKGHLVLTAGGLAREHADRGYLSLVAAQDRGEATWSGHWHLYTFSVPERFRSERDALRSALVRLGAAPLAHGVYVSPFPLRAELEGETSDRYLITAEALRIAGPGLETPQRAAETLWPAAEIEAGYAPLSDVLDAVASAPQGASLPERLGCSLRLAEAFSFALERDPLVPPELRGSGWSPPETRRRFRSVWTALQADLPDVRLFRGYEEFVRP